MTASGHQEPRRFVTGATGAPQKPAAVAAPDDRKLETCKLNDVDPQAWLADVLARLSDPPRESDLRNAAAELESRSPSNRDLIIHLSPRPDQPTVLLRCMCACNARRVLLMAFN